ncbi:hypothetical protein DFR59_11154 [Falsibacillus pallidus]|uniref:Uncharacterized protein n=1 Tax=Falsibacillus pallidus TaxID=493781 RepID=A0A370GB04_9BACI|nr:hypothetical protein DFR59_11154 [Falsibacillus pallidus]
MLFCPKCGGIQEVIKIHDSKNFEPRLCDVQCFKCDHIVYYQPYDFGKSLNLVSNDLLKKEDKKS